MAGLQRLYDLAFEDDTSDEDEFVVRRPRWIRQRENHFNLDDTDFLMRFRLSKQAVLLVLESIEEQLEYQSDRNNSISPIDQLLCTLRYYATGCHQLTCADFGGFSKSTAHRIIHRVSAAIASLLPLHVTFPTTPEERQITKSDFYRIASFPRVLGAVDCTHVKIQNPGGDNAELFRNRKGFFSLNVQAICNSRLEFTDIVARWPGSTHDSHIFNNCVRKIYFEDQRYGDGVLVGDSGYACRSYLMTPFDRCDSAAEQLYNESIIRTRNPVERMFGIWKRRFPVLALGIRVKLEKTFPIIVSTAVLHNILRRRGEELPPDDPNSALPAPWEILIAQGDIGQEPIAALPRRENPNFHERRNIVNHYFTRLVALEGQQRGRGQENDENAQQY